MLIVKIRCRSERAGFEIEDLPPDRRADDRRSEDKTLLEAIFAKASESESAEFLNPTPRMRQKTITHP
jgi:hypothetical protein